MGLVLRRLPDDLWRDLGLLFQGRITPFGELIESPSRRSSQIIYATPGLPPDHPNAVVLKVGTTGGVNFTVGGDYARHGDRPDMGGEIKRGARAFRNFIQENPNVYYNNPFMPDGFGKNRARFYRSQGFVDVIGKDAKSFLEKVVANNVNKLKNNGQALYGCLLNEHAGVIDDLMVIS